MPALSAGSVISLNVAASYRPNGFDITLPLLKPYVTLVAVISAIAATKVFEEVFLMTQGGPADSTRTLVYYVYDQAFAELEISYACTVGLALFLIVLLLTAIRFAFAEDQSLI